MSKTTKFVAAFWVLFGFSLTLAGCATPTERIKAVAKRYGFNRQLVPSKDFLHVIYSNAQYRSEQIPKARGEKDPATKALPTQSLHIYIEGDGSPWRRPTEIAEDPTPHHPLMLQLMAYDPAPSIYLGRPCYLGLAKIPPCTPLLWTYARYSEQVVRSMAAAIRYLIRDSSKVNLVWLGHSGGGTLALLLAERFETTRAVITLAGNLDIESWATLHHYTPLRGSLNPLSRPTLKPRIFQRHYVGLQDKEIPPYLTKRYVATHPTAEVVEMQGIEHTCCWEAIWPDILDDLEDSLIERFKQILN